MVEKRRVRPLRIVRCGRIGFHAALALQEEIGAQVADGRANEALLLLEHPHVLTLGVSGNPGHILASADELRRKAIEVIKIRRGGDVTYHGLGQLVGYPIIRFSPGNRSVKGFISTLEQVIIDTLATYGIGASRKAGLTGVWAGEAKIASIGIGISRWTTRHGFALNVNTDLTYFDLIIPCGHPETRMTSMQALLGREVPLEDVIDPLAGCFLRLFDMVAERPG